MFSTRTQWLVAFFSLALAGGTSLGQAVPPEKAVWLWAFLQQFQLLRPSRDAGIRQGLDISVHIKNTSDVSGDEVPQVYLDAPQERPEGVQFAARTLAAFDRVTLGPGETREVTMHVAPRSLEYWSTAENRWMASGSRRVNVGSSSRDLKLSASPQ